MNSRNPYPRRHRKGGADFFLPGRAFHLHTVAGDPSLETEVSLQVSTNGAAGIRAGPWSGKKFIPRENSLPLIGVLRVAHFLFNQLSISHIDTSMSFLNWTTEKPLAQPLLYSPAWVRGAASGAGPKRKQTGSAEEAANGRWTMGSDKKQKLGAEELERRMAPGRLTYDSPAEPGTTGDDAGSLESPSAKEVKKGGRRRSQQVSRN